MRKLPFTLMAAVVALALAPVLHARSDGGARTGDTAKAAGTTKADEKDSFKKLTVDEVAKLIKDPTVHVYDGNRQELYKENHVPGAVLLYSKDIKDGVLPARKDTTLIFYCHNEL